MTRVSIVLLLMVIASALFLVRTQYESRLLYTELDRAVAEARRLSGAPPFKQAPGAMVFASTARSLPWAGKLAF